MNRIWKGEKKCLCVVLSLFVLFAEVAESGFCVGCVVAQAAAKTKSPAPPYRRAGPIPGTNLGYENLNVDSSGRVSVTISNTERAGVFFTANFAFYDETNNYLTGFVLDGHVPGMTKNGYALRLPDAGNMRKAAFLKVLGRAGRTQEE